MFSDSSDFSLPQSYRKMISVNIKGQTMKVGQFIWARCVSPFPSTGSPSLHTVFSDPNVRPAKIFFFTHTIEVKPFEFISHSFAHVFWPIHHPLHRCISKPFEIWSSNMFDNTSDNCFIPVQNIISLSLTAHQVYEDEAVLVTVPLVS